MARRKILKDKRQIIDVALRLIETEGLEAVTMVRLSKELGVSSMTLYNYVRNADDVLREILVETFSNLYEKIYSTMSSMTETGVSGIEAYAKAYANALYDLATEHRDICVYLIGEGYTNYYNNIELRLFYNPFGIFILGDETSAEAKDWKDAFHLYECVIFSLIHEYTVGSRILEKKEYIRLVDKSISKIFPKP